MQVLLIGNRETAENPEAYYEQYRSFFEAAAKKSKKSPEIVYTLFEDLIISVGDGEFAIYDSKNQTDIANFDLILIRGKGFRNYFDVVKTISIYCTSQNISVVNNYQTFRDSSKLAQATQFHLAGVPVAKTIFVTKAVLSGQHDLGISFPCIMKATFGAHGNDNYLVKSIEEAQQIAKQSPQLNFVLQRFVPNNKDFRILVIGKEILVFSRKAVEGTHLNNTSQGGQAELVPNQSLPKKVLEDAVKIAEQLDMTFAGVDALEDANTGEYYFLEVNSQPQLMSGAFIEEKSTIIAQYFDAL
jgi:glutathione synthase/RimK-type ligase-like ATP-grasp enzyme